MRIEWEEDKEFTEDQMRDMSLEKHNKLITSGRWYKKDNKDNNILALLGVDQKVADDSNKRSEKSNTSIREYTKVDPAYTMDLPPRIPEKTKGGVVNKTKDGK